MTGCNCHSYNRNVGEKPEVVLPRPWFMEGTDERLNGVPVDACIADVVTMLWDHRIITLSSCCGHGTQQPSLVMDTSDDWKQAEKLIAEHDGRPFTFYQWQLVRLPSGMANVA